ncbi:hypothetical protein [Streptacidiphilus jeojiense]|uniref:Uncharacterized protein n=2 Tax=Streptacidiphilus cavernicola TaxID=3342716 RepID=A0ABV6UWI1_9ACTN|nr:hypothetical protein [Streptacidiphilus jeojiense]
MKVKDHLHAASRHQAPEAVELAVQELRSATTSAAAAARGAGVGYFEIGRALGLIEDAAIILTVAAAAVSPAVG